MRHIMVTAHNIAHSKIAILINLFTRWMSSDIVGCVHVDVVVVIVIAMCGDVKLLGWQAQQKQRQKQKNN